VRGECGKPINDPLETRAIREVFGAHADRLAVSSTKLLHGHALGTTGAMEAVCTILALRNGLLPPTANFTVPDSDCNLDVVPNRARQAQVRSCEPGRSAGFSRRSARLDKPILHALGEYHLDAVSGAECNRG
jgi:3-oxoacyl-(acyl-carrier-protein) synthase